MNHDADPNASLTCYRCGAALTKLTLPFSRLDQCPACGVEMHVCRMCSSFSPTAPDACTEDDAEPVTNKTGANFCAWFTPAADTFDSAARQTEVRARDSLDALFGDAAEPEEGQSSGTDPDDPLAKANALFDR